MLYSLISGIEDTPLFSGVSKNHTSKYLNKSTITVKSFEANAVAYSSKSEETQVAIIVAGAARVYSGGENEKALMRTLNKGDIFGVANLYGSDSPFPTRIIAATDLTILFIDGEAFKKFIENDAAATRNYIAFLSGRIVFLNKKLATLTAGSTEKKLAVYILDHTVDGQLIMPCSFCELAKTLNIGRASLYRDIETLENNGMIKRNGKTFTVIDKNALSEMIK